MRLFKKRICFFLPKSHVDIKQVCKEIEKLLEEGSEVFPCLLTGSEKNENTEKWQEDLQKITNKKMLEISPEEESLALKTTNFNLLVIAPCPSYILIKILKNSTESATKVKRPIFSRTSVPIVLALAANGKAGDLVFQIKQLLDLENTYLVPFSIAGAKKRTIIVTRLDLIKETVIHACAQKQLQPVIFENHWLPE